MVHHEHFPNRAEAMSRERELKGGRGRRWLLGYLNGRAGPPMAD